MIIYPNIAARRQQMTVVFGGSEADRWFWLRSPSWEMVPLESTTLYRIGLPSIEWKLSRGRILSRYLYSMSLNMSEFVSLVESFAFDNRYRNYGSFQIHVYVNYKNLCCRFQQANCLLTIKVRRYMFVFDIQEYSLLGQNLICLQS